MMIRRRKHQKKISSKTRDRAQIEQAQNVIKKEHSENKKIVAWTAQIKSLEEGVEDRIADEKISQKAEQKDEQTTGERPRGQSRSNPGGLTSN